MITVQVNSVVRDEGTLVVFSGYELTESGEVRHEITFVADHRYAQDLVDAIEENEDAICGLEDWQILTVSQVKP